jgi:YesN/AraC family two-component response regulator
MKKIPPLLYFILFSCITLLAQDKNFKIPDSLANKTNTELIQLIKVNRYSSPVIAKVYAEAFYKKATAEKNRINIIDSYFYFGHIADIQGEYTNAISLINKGISLTETDRDSILWKLYNLRGKVQEQYGKDEEAAADFNASLLISKEYDYKPGIIIAEIGIAKVKLNTKQYYESLKIYEEMLRISEDTILVSKNSRASIFIGICDNYLKMQALDSARIYLDQGLKESIRINDLESASYFYPFEAIYYYYKNDIPKSLVMLEKAQKAISAMESEEKRIIEVYYYMAQCHFALKDYQAAITTVEKAFAIIREENIEKDMTDTTSVSDKKLTTISDKDQFIPYEYMYLLKLIVSSYEKLGDTKHRGLYFEKYFKLKLESEQKDVRINKLLYNFHEAPEIALMKELSQKETAAEKLVNYLYYILALLCVAIAVGYILSKRKEKKKQIAYKALIEKVSVLEAENSAAAEENNTATSKTVSITDEKAASILKGLQKFEAQEQFLDENCNLRFVAKKVKTNATYLSKIINTHKESSFNEYINNLRIQYTLKRLKSDTQFRAYSIKSIAQEVGYKSADSFTKHFKKQTSLYPSYYIKNLNKEA